MNAYRKTEAPECTEATSKFDRALALVHQYGAEEGQTFDTTDYPGSKAKARAWVEENV
jgi:hypothetical protein